MQGMLRYESGFDLRPYLICTIRAWCRSHPACDPRHFRRRRQLLGAEHAPGCLALIRVSDGCASAVRVSRPAVPRAVCPHPLTHNVYIAIPPIHIGHRVALAPATWAVRRHTSKMYSRSLPPGWPVRRQRFWCKFGGRKHKKNQSGLTRW